MDKLLIDKKIWIDHGFIGLWMYSSMLAGDSQEKPDEFMYERKRLGISTVSLVKKMLELLVLL